MKKNRSYIVEVNTEEVEEWIPEALPVDVD